MIQLEHNEKIIAVFRKHWFVVLSEFFGLLIMAIIPLILFIYGQKTLGMMSSEGLAGLVFLYALYLLILWVVAFVVWLDFYLDKLVLTTERLIEIEQYGLFSREVSSLHLSNVQDVTINVHGIIQTLFKMGDLHVQTSAAEVEVRLAYLAHPELAKHLVMKEHAKILNRSQAVHIQKPINQKHE